MANSLVVGDFIAAAGKRGRFFAVTFVKRTTGEKRTMTARLGVRKGVKGVGLAFDPADYNLMVVWDAQKREFRMVNLDTVTEVRVAGWRVSFEASPLRLTFDNGKTQEHNGGQEKRVEHRKEARGGIRQKGGKADA